MRRCFWQSIVTMIIGFVATFGVLIKVIIDRLNSEMWILVISVIMVSMLGTLLTLLFSNFITERAYHKILSIFFIDLDSQKFIDTFQKTPYKVSKNTAKRAMAFSYLLDGYCANLNYDDARKIISNELIVTENKKLSLSMFKTNSTLHAFLQMGDIENAQETMTRFTEIAKKVNRSGNWQLYSNMEKIYKIYEQELNYLLGKEINLKVILKAIENEKVLPRKLELMILVAKATKDKDIKVYAEMMEKLTDNACKNLKFVYDFINQQ